MPSLNVLDYSPRFQWNQEGISRCLARTACTDTTVQMIIEYYTEKLVSLSAIRKASGQAIDCETGLSMSETFKALEAFGVTHYKPALGVDASFALSKAVNGPVIVGVGYYRYPNKIGYCRSGNHAIQGGRIDCGFGGAHAVLVVGNTVVSINNRVVRYDAFVRDPDHYELTPPQYDRITMGQLQTTMQALKTVGKWNTTFAIYTDTKKKLSVPPQPQPPSKAEDTMFNIGPSSTYRDATLKAGTVLYKDSALTERVSGVDVETDLGFLGSGKTYHVVVNGGNTQYIRREDAITTSKMNTRNYT